MSYGRPGNIEAPCEAFHPNLSFTQSVQAGARLKVGWISGNRGGGFVRLALAPSTDVLDPTSFDK